MSITTMFEFFKLHIQDMQPNLTGDSEVTDNIVTLMFLKIVSGEL